LQNININTVFFFFFLHIKDVLKFLEYLNQNLQPQISQNKPFFLQYFFPNLLPGHLCYVQQHHYVIMEEKKLPGKIIHGAITFSPKAHLATAFRR